MLGVNAETAIQCSVLRLRYILRLHCEI